VVHFGMDDRFLALPWVVYLNFIMPRGSHQAQFLRSINADLSICYTCDALLMLSSRSAGERKGKRSMNRRMEALLHGFLGAESVLREAEEHLGMMVFKVDPKNRYSKYG
jgi:hypothetical protein